ncbi:MAG: hypothetical protein H6750_06370 [Nitrospiraceae bacterium]|nr:hypothetical protein [Nitrospiraceae bacterium]
MRSDLVLIPPLSRSKIESLKALGYKIRAGVLIGDPVHREQDAQGNTVDRIGSADNAMLFIRIDP